jgi:hypothetical protein
LQQLALFSEYGRMALARDKYDDEADVIPVTPGKVSDAPPVTPARGSSNSTSTPPRTVFKTPKTSLKRVPVEEESDEEIEKPFQLLEFLVRDWQNFDDDETVPQMQKAMDTYLREVIKDRDVSDLQVGDLPLCAMCKVTYHFVLCKSEIS